MASVASFVSWLTFPLSLSFVLAVLAGLALLAHRRRTGRLLLAAALAWSAVWSLPACSDWLRGTLERRSEVVPAAALPQADAIVVLGGADHSYWVNRPGVSADELESSRLAAGARAWLAGRAPVVILTGGGGSRGNSEASRMASAITRLGVPETALLLEERSRDTRDNARYTAELATALDMRRLLLVTSSLHMPRAMLQFRRAGLDVVAVPAPDRRIARTWLQRWVPTPRAMVRSARALKEYAGLLGVHVEGVIEDARGAAARRNGCTRGRITTAS